MYIYIIYIYINLQAIKQILGQENILSCSLCNIVQTIGATSINEQYYRYS